MICILLPYLSGCISTKVISKSDLPLPNTSRYSYVVHSERSKYLLEKKSIISGGILSGRINTKYSDNSYDGVNRIHLYLTSDSVIKIDKGEYLSVPINEVTKVEIQEIQEMRGVGTFFKVLGITLGVLIAVGLISWAIDPPQFGL